MSYGVFRLSGKRGKGYYVHVAFIEEIVDCEDIHLEDASFAYFEDAIQVADIDYSSPPTVIPMLFSEEMASEDAFAVPINNNRYADNVSVYDSVSCKLN